MASNTDKLRKLARRWVGQIGSGGVADDSVTTIPLSSATNLPTDTAVTLVIDRVDSNGSSTSALEETIVGVVSGSNIVSAVRGVEGTAQAHSAGAVVELLWTADNWNDMVDWGVVEHNQDGTHKSALVTTLKTTGAKINTGTADDEIVTPKAIQDSNIVQSDKNWDGWISVSDTWTYASSTTINVPSGATAIYTKGDKIRLKQGGGYKYFYVVGVANTVLTVTGGSDYTVADATITDNYYSHASSPIGFPNYFNYTPEWTATTTNPSLGNGTATGKFYLQGILCFTFGKIVTGNTTSFGSGVYSFSLPITSIITDGGDSGLHGTGSAVRSGASRYQLLAVLNSATTVELDKTEPPFNGITESAPATWANPDSFTFTFVYLI